MSNAQHPNRKISSITSYWFLQLGLEVEHYHITYHIGNRKLPSIAKQNVMYSVSLIMELIQNKKDNNNSSKVK